MSGDADDMSEAEYMDMTGIGCHAPSASWQDDDDIFLTEDEIEAMRKWHAHNKRMPKGATIACSACGRLIVKRHPAKATCSRVCLDFYHNTAAPDRACRALSRGGQS